MLRLAVTGATGTMGRAVRDVARERDDIELALLITRGSPESVSSTVAVSHPDQLDSAFSTHAVDVIVDFTEPAASVELVEAAATAEIGAVVGTTGFDESQDARLRALADETPLLVAPNFSRGVQALLAALAGAVAHLPDVDIEITETHHRRKVDAPSGTATRILEILEDARPGLSPVHGRHGHAPREKDEVGVHARRAGTITGSHEILLAGHAEEVRLVHRAESREVFAAGALDAATWLADKSPGWYRFAEVVQA